MFSKEATFSSFKVAALLCAVPQSLASVSRIVAVGIAVIIIAAVVAGAGIYYLGAGGPITSGTGTGSGSGRLAVLMTDPPYASGSNSKIYEHYNNLAAERRQSGGQTTTGGATGQWVMLNVSGSLQLNALVNSSQTIAFSNVAAGSYDSVKLFVDSAVVTSGGKNYTATVRSGKVTAKINGNAEVTSSGTAVVIFDQRTLAINTGTSSSPVFVLSASARADVVSSSDVSSSSLNVGAKIDLSSAAWFQAIASSSAHLKISSAAISANSLSVTLMNAGSEPAEVRIVIVTPVNIVGQLGVSIPGALQGSAVFLVGANGNLQSTSAFGGDVLFSSTGANVSSSSSTNLSFGGYINFASGVIMEGVQSGGTYQITVIGDNSAATTTAVAP